MKGIEVSKQDGGVVVRFKAVKLTDDDQILSLSDELREALDSVLSGERLLIDFQNVEIVASMLLGDLVLLNKAAARQGVSLQFCRLSSDVMRVISTCQLDRLFDILPDASPDE
ncbi:MAG: STAS domain-containing protein [Planctomycetaceae bacterium]|nr:STAS domain-containing protein [Planctomycetales bacterium]MCB9875152.1 STAS domain-containing protein [Planctomycetaceae bacterium]MCB9937183.1 STAS domain-containing protein [Planctomycetaceae bacterium]